MKQYLYISLSVLLLQACRTEAPVHEEKGAGGYAKYMFDLRKNPLTGETDYNAMLRAREEVRLAALNSKKTSATLSWKELGPSNMGGRTRAVLIDNQNPNKIYACGISGGLWISTNYGANWSKWSGTDQLENMAISAIAQASNGDIYFGTGEGLYYFLGIGAGGIVGGGMWRSTDGGLTFNRIASTIPALNVSNHAWAAINNIAIDPNNPNKIYAATDFGLRLSTNGGMTWSHPVRHVNGNANTSKATDVEVASDGTVFAAINSKCYKSLTGDSGTFVNISTGGTLLPSGASGRLELAISPTDPNYVYATATSGGSLYGVYQSIDKGLSWKQIGAGGSTQFAPFGISPYGQADYDNALAVDPFDKTHLILGGVELWRWKQNTSTSTGVGQWTKIAVYNGAYQAPYYVHADVHTIQFDKTVQGRCYFGTDGGVFRSPSMHFSAPVFIACNSDYNVMQCYSVAFEHDNTSPLGSGVIAGTQDNGTVYINGYPNGSNLMWATEISTGDGGDLEISSLDPRIFFTTIYYGKLYRSSNLGANPTSMYSGKITALPNFLLPGFASFVTPVSLYENGNTLNSPDSVIYIADSNYAANSIVKVISQVNGKLKFNYKTPVALTKGQSVKVQDIMQSKIVVGFSGSNGVWLHRHAINLSKPNEWLRIAGSAQAGRQISGEVESFAWSADGDILYFGTSNGYLYRLKNMAAIVDSVNGDIGTNTWSNPNCIIQQSVIRSFGSGRFVTGISVDPNDPDNVAVTIANYGYTDYVYYSTNATSATPVFSAKQGVSSGKLPSMPAYNIIIEKSNPKRVLVATEYGVYKTEDITQGPATIVWTQENQNGMANVPVFSIRQQRLEAWHTLESQGVIKPITNSGRIYIGTHGRGVFSCDDYYTAPTGIVNHQSANANNVKLFPNPANSSTRLAFNAPERGNVSVFVYDLRGSQVRTYDLGKLPEGRQEAFLDLEGLAQGTYLVAVNTGALKQTAKLIVQGK